MMKGKRVQGNDKKHVEINIQNNARIPYPMVTATWFSSSGTVRSRRSLSNGRERREKP